MSRLALLVFGARLAVTGGRSSRTRVALMAGGMAVGVAMLLGLFSVLPAVVAHQARAAARAPSDEGGPVSTGAHVRETQGLYRGKTMTTVSVFTDGPVHRLPAGLDRLPDAGEVVVSTALRAELSGRHAGELAPRLPGRVVGTVDSDGLVGPAELFAWVGVAEDPAPTTGAPAAVRLFGTPTPQPVGLLGNDRVALQLAFVGLLVPVLVLVATMSRLSAAARERRLAALRLVGASRRQTRWFAAGETGLAAVVGVLGGAALFLALRGPAIALFPVGSGVYAGDVTPSATGLVLVASGVPAVAVGTAVVALRRVVTGPLGVTRQAPPRTVGWWRLLPLTAGLLLLVGAWADRRAVLSGDPLGATLLLGGAGLSLVGLAVAAAAVARLGGVVLHRWGPGLASELAGRRLQSDPTAAARVLTGAMLVVAVVGFLLGFLPLLDSSKGGGSYDAQIRATAPGTMTARFDGSGEKSGPAAAAAVRRVLGVRTALSVPELGISPAGPGRAGRAADAFPKQALVVTCRQLEPFLRADLRGCADVPAYRITRSFGEDAHALGAGTWQLTGSDGAPAGTVRLPDDPPELSVPAGFSDLLFGSVLVAPALVTSAPGAQPRTQAVLLVATDGRASTVERVRSALWNSGEGEGTMTLTEARRLGLGSSSTYYRRAALFGVAFALLAASLSFSVTTADSLRERRRGLASLVALGAPVRVLRRSVLQEIAVPLLLNIGLATAASIAGTVLYLSLGSEDGRHPVELPWTGWSLVAVAAVASVLLATTVTLPFIRATVRPDALRAE